MTLQTKKRIIIALFLAAAIFIVHKIGITRYINFEFFAANRETIQQFITQHYWASVLIFILINAFIVAVALPISALLNIIAGYLFGVLPATIYTNIAATLGALSAFLMVRYLLADAFKKKYAKAAAAFEQEFEKRGANYLLAMQLFPLTPFALINIMAALSGISTWTFYWATAVGILPGQFIYSYAGRQLATVDSVKDVMTPSLMLALVLLALLSLVPMVLRRLGLIK